MDHIIPFSEIIKPPAFTSTQAAYYLSRLIRHPIHKCLFPDSHDLIYKIVGDIQLI